MDNPQSQTEVQPGQPNGRAAKLTTSRHEPSLEGVDGTVRFSVGPDPFITLKIHHGDVSILPNDAPVDVTLLCQTKQDALGLLRGELNPMVAALQGRLGLEGDYGLAIKVLYGFHGGGYPFVTPAEV
jgi:putative sterol carrier protein